MGERSKIVDPQFPKIKITDSFVFGNSACSPSEDKREMTEADISLRRRCRDHSINLNRSGHAGM